MVLIDFLNKTIPGGGKKQPGGAKKILPPLAKILCTRLFMAIYLFSQILKFT